MNQLLGFLVGILVIGLPFVVSFEGLDKFRLPKDVFAALGILLAGAIGFMSRRMDWRRRLGGWEILLLGAFSYALLHSLVLGRTEASLPALRGILYYILLILVLTEIASQRLQQRLWLWIAVATAVNAVMTILQYLGRFPLILRPSGETIFGRLNPAGLIGDVNSGGFLFGLVCLPLLYSIVVDKRTLIRIVAVVLLGLNVSGLAFTFTLTSMVALAVCLLLWLVFHHWWVFQTQRRITRALVVFWIGLALGALGAGYVALRAGALGRVVVVWAGVKQGDWASVTAGRQPVYAITWEMIKERPWFGRGLQTFGRDFFHFRADHPAGHRVELMDHPGAFREAHNEYLQVWEELGLAGLALFLALLVMPLFGAFRLWLVSKDPPKVYWAGMLSLGLVFVAISALTFFPLHLSVTVTYVVLLWAGLRRVVGEDRWAVAARPRASQAPRFWEDARLKALAAIAVGLWLGYSEIQRWRANFELGVASFVIDRAATSRLAVWQQRVYADTALQRLRKAEALAPTLCENYALQGTAALLMRDYAEAVRQYERSAGCLPGPEVFTNLATAYLAQNQLDKAESLLEMALRYNPRYGRARSALRFLETKRP